MSFQDLKRVLDSGKLIRIIDVRPPTEFGICQLPGSINVPIRDLVANPAKHAVALGVMSRAVPETTEPFIDHHPYEVEMEETYIVCRLGNDSRIAVEALRTVGLIGVIKDLVGGLRAWTREVDETFPVY